MRYVIAVVLAVVLAGCLSAGAGADSDLMRAGTTLTYSYGVDAGTGAVRAHVTGEDTDAWRGFLAHEVNDTVQVHRFRLERTSGGLTVTGSLSEEQLDWKNRSYTASRLRIDVFPFLIPALGMADGFSVDALIENGSTTYSAGGRSLQVHNEGQTSVDGRAVYNITLGPGGSITQRDRSFVTTAFPHVLVRHRDLASNSSVILESIERGSIDISRRYGDHTWVTG